MSCYHKKPLCFCFLSTYVIFSLGISSSVPGWKHRQSHVFSEHTLDVENLTITLSYKIQS